MEDIAGAKNFSRTPTSWDAEDDILLMHLKDSQKLGWKEIASHFNNRTPNACQFRWRRLKLGNLKNPPKSLGGAEGKAGLSKAGSTTPGPVGGAGLKRKAMSPSSMGTPSKSNIGGVVGSGPFGLSPGVTFTGYDNNVSNALAGLNALLNTPSNISTPGSYHPSPIPSAITPTGTSNSSGRHNSFGLPVSLDPQPPLAAAAAAASNGGGYYADILIDPTMNLPHNQPHPHAARSVKSSNGSGGLNGANGAGSGGQSGTNTGGDNSRRNSTPIASSSSSSSGKEREHSASGQSSSIIHHRNGSIVGPSFHSNSIIQIVKDERTSISSPTRASVSSLPSKSMNIPHHQLNNNALAHLPVLFGSGGSISGPSPNPSISGASGHGGSVSQQTVTSLRNGSVGSATASGGGNGGGSGGYYSRSGSVVIPFNAEKREDYKIEKKSNLAIAAAAVAATTKHFQNHQAKPSKKAASNTNHNSKDSHNSKAGNTKNGANLFKIPWSMEEDELLINRRNRELSFAELSILLPQRTEGEIWSRIDHLEKLRNGHRASRVNRRRQSLIGLDDVDDFYDVEDVMIDTDDEDDDDEVLLDDDETLGGGPVRRKKRRASSAVNPLSVDRRRLR